MKKFKERPNIAHETSTWTEYFDLMIQVSINRDFHIIVSNRKRYDGV